MSKADIVVLTNVSMITAVVQRGAADALVRAASDAGSEGATIYFGRGSGVRERLGILGLAVEAEKEIVNILVANDQVDRVFEKIFVAAKLDTPGMGILFVTPLEKAATYIPDSMLEKLLKD